MRHKLEKGTATVILEIALSLTLKDKIRLESKKYGMNMSEYVRETVLHRIDVDNFTDSEESLK